MWMLFGYLVSVDLNFFLDGWMYIPIAHSESEREKGKGKRKEKGGKIQYILATESLLGGWGVGETETKRKEGFLSCMYI